MKQRGEMVVPGSLPLGTFETLIRALEQQCGAGDAGKGLTAEKYFQTVKAFVFAVPSSADDGELSDEEQTLLLERAMGCTKTVFMSRVRARLRRVAREQAASEATKKKLKSKLK